MCFAPLSWSVAPHTLTLCTSVNKSAKYSQGHRRHTECGALLACAISYSAREYNPSALSLLLISTAVLSATLIAKIKLLMSTPVQSASLIAKTMHILWLQPRLLLRRSLGDKAQ